MLINFKKPLKNLKGEVIKDEKGEEQLVSDFVCGALLNNYPGDESLPASKRIERAKLAERIAMQDEVDINVTDLAMIHELCGKSLHTLVLLNVDRIISGEA